MRRATKNAVMNGGRPAKLPQKGASMSHILLVIVGGLVGLAVFYFGYRMFGRPGAAGAALFIWVWLAASLLNGAVGVFKAGIPLINEIGAFIPIFGIPAAAACYLGYRLG
jgi:hypothetical protein